ncbi:MAG: alpha/beta hydrolase [Pseudomonadota bacterium]
MNINCRSVIRQSIALTVVLIAATCGGQFASAAADESAGALTPARHAKPSILLVHGAFAGALAWQKVTTLLQQRGYTVVAVENPLTSLDTDVATTKRAIAALAAKGPLVVVGHSYGGMVITGQPSTPRR